MKNLSRTILMLFIVALIAVPVFAGGQNEGSTAAESNTLRVAMECGYAPYNWTQTSDANGAVPIDGSSSYAYGYDVIMAKKIAAALGKELVIVKLDWDSLVPAVQSHSVDCVIAGQSPTTARKEMVDFTDPYYYASIIALTTNDSEYADATGLSDLAGGTCTSQLSTIWYDKCLPQIPNANIIAAQESAPAMLVALNSGRVDFVCTDLPTAQAALIAYPNFTILDFTGSDDNFQVSQEDIDISVSVAKDRPELTQAINEVLSTMDETDYNNMMDAAIKVQPLAN